MDTARTANAPWQVSWADGQWMHMPGSKVHVLEVDRTWGAALVEFANPSAIEQPPLVAAVVPWDDLDRHTSPCTR
jgi:hypothetical protein